MDWIYFFVVLLNLCMVSLYAFSVFQSATEYRKMEDEWKDFASACVKLEGDDVARYVQNYIATLIVKKRSLLLEVIGIKVLLAILFLFDLTTALVKILW